MKRFLTLIVLLAFAIIMPAQTLSLEEAKALARKNNPEYQSKLAEYEAVKWNTQAVLGSALPALNLSGTYLYSDPVTTVAGGIKLNNDLRTISLNLSQPIFLGGKVWQAYQLGKLNERMSELSLRSFGITLGLEVEKKYQSVQSLIQAEQLSQKQFNSAQKNMLMAELKYESGLISEADLLRFRSTLATREIALLQADMALELAQSDLSNYLGIDSLPELEQASLDIADPLLERLVMMDKAASDAFVNNALGYAQGNNLGIKALETSTALAKKAYGISKSAFLPSVMLTGSRQFRENGIDRYEFTGSNQIMLTASFAILPQYANYAATRKAYHDYRAGLQRSKNSINGISLGVQSSVLSLITTAKQVKAAKLARDYSALSYAQLVERFSLNMLSAAELIDAEVMDSAAALALINANMNYQKSLSALLGALGSEDINLITTLLDK